MDKCNVYDLDYKKLSQIAMEKGQTAEDYVEGAITTKNCTNFVFETVDFESSIVTDVSL